MGVCWWSRRNQLLLRLSCHLLTGASKSLTLSFGGELDDGAGVYILPEQLNNVKWFGIWPLKLLQKSLEGSQHCIPDSWLSTREVLYEHYRNQIFCVFILGYPCKKPRDVFISFNKSKLQVIPSWLCGLLKLWKQSQKNNNNNKINKSILPNAHVRSLSWTNL